MNQQPLYRTFQQFLSEHIEGKVQKIALNAGFTCPNRDGVKGYGGCTYCNNQTFNPAYCVTEKSVTVQMEEGIRFFAGKYPKMNYLAYFQAYTNTYGELEQLKKLYEEALSVPKTVGLVVGTRPDCMPDDLLDYFEALSKQVFVLIEYGVESTLDRTLTTINRGHDYACSADAIRRTAARGIPVGAHIILGLPAENQTEMVKHADALNELPLDTLKLHQLQLIRGTRLAMQVAQDSSFIPRFTASDYANLIVNFLERLKPAIAVERFVSQSPPELLIAPDWGLKNYEFTHLVEKRLKQTGSYQGKCYSGSGYSSNAYSTLLR
ncbi:MAG: TIGR01212 family radical SAM protein [Bacteroidota bacterium]|nr:TIGR01212 family radical SAM protein [Bacteroidota bacterium]